MNYQTSTVKSSKDQAFPEGFLHTFSTADIKNPCEGLIVLLHSFLLEVDFVPKDVDSGVFNCMPQNWKSSNFSRINYYHKSLPLAFCWVTCVPLGGKLSIYGSAVKEDVEDSSYWTLDINSFVNIKEPLSDPSSLFKNVEALSRSFKDEFCFPLLALLQESVYHKSTFGLNGLVGEVKNVILMFLPVESIVTMSAVNKEFRNHANSSFLWKRLFIRDYGLDASGSSSSSLNWKEMYKQEYTRRKIRPHAFRPDFGLFLPYHMPPIFPVARPHYGYDPRIDMDPALQQAFPHLRDRFRPSNLFFPGGNDYFDDLLL